MKPRSTPVGAHDRSSLFRTVVVPSTFLAGGVLGLYALVRGNARTRDGSSRKPADPIDDGVASLANANAELRRAKEAAEAANEAKTRYLVSVSHEIRSPLNAIYGYAQLLERAGAIPSAEAGAVIRRSAEHLTNLVESLLEISRIESGVIKLRSDVVPIRALLQQVLDMFRVQAAAKGLSLDLKISDRLPNDVRVDGKRLRQILINLVSNAIKYTQAGGATITVNYRSQVADVEVSDTGIGIPADDLERVFDPFERGSAPEAQRQPGIGLGLAITRVLARVMGGDIAVTSAAGIGSTFRLRLMLPAARLPAGEAPQSSRIEGYRGDPRTVLVVDDDPHQIAVLQSLLRPLGFIVYAAGDGPEGIALAAHCSADIALLDIQMPGMNGWETAERLRRLYGDRLKIVMVSANAHEMRVGNDGSSSHDAFLTKPIDLDALLTTIGSQLDLRWTTAESPHHPEPNPALTPLPADATPFIEQIRHSASMGHVRGVEDGLRDMEDAFPEAAGLVTLLHQHLSNFDLRSLIKMLDDAKR